MKDISFRISGQKVNVICKANCKAKYLGLVHDEHLTF